MSDKKKESAVLDMCGAVSCKGKTKQFGFCGDHFEQFKFGLIKKDGQKAADYEKKFEHFQNFLAKRAGSKPAKRVA